MNELQDIPEEVRDDSTVLSLLLDTYPARYSEEELARELDWPAFRTEDALYRLWRHGLIHREKPFAFATRSAVRAHELSV